MIEKRLPTLQEKLDELENRSDIVVNKIEFDAKGLAESIKNERKDWIIVMNALLAFAERVQGNSSNTEAKFVTRGTKITVSGKPVKIRVNGEVVAPEQLSKFLINFSNLDETCERVHGMINLEREGYLEDLKETIREVKALQREQRKQYDGVVSMFGHVNNNINRLVDKTSKRFSWFVDIRNYMHWSVYVTGSAALMFMLVCTIRYLF